MCLAVYGTSRAGVAADLAVRIAKHVRALTAAGRWSLRHVLAGLLSAPESAGRLLADADLD